MPVIKSVSVEQLATRRIDKKIDLNPDVNVFYGQNGSGKTSLLRILDSAMSGRANDIKSVPFAYASVEFGDAYVFNQEGDNFAGDLTRQTLIEAPPSNQLTLSSEAPEFRKTERGSKKIWYSFEPSIEDQSFNIRHVYLPISRLYVSDDRRFPRSLRDNRGLMSEAALEDFFAEVVNFLWLRYTRNTSLEIQEAQSTGLNEVLADFVRPDPEADESYDTDIKEAYRRLDAFLSRQDRNIEIPLETFADRLQKDKRMRRVLRVIEAVESTVDYIKRPRNEFDRILRRMISSEKKVELGSRDIHAYAESEEIRLGSLSSGEKQLLRICIEALLSDGAPVLIDEPELSMHIDWQRELIPAIRSLAPASQLVFATHSPEIMAPLADRQIFEL